MGLLLSEALSQPALPPLSAVAARDFQPPFFFSSSSIPKPTKFLSHSLSTNHISLPSDPYNPLTSTSYASLLESCNCPIFGKQVHCHAIKNGFRGHDFVETKLLQMYCKCGSLADAFKMFDKMPVRNLYSWTAILNVFIHHGLFEDALFMLLDLQLEDLELKFFVFPLLLKISSGLDSVELGRQLHGIVIKSAFLSNIYVGNALIDMYGKCRNLDEAMKVLVNMPERDLVSWNAIITAFAANGKVYDALDYLRRMWLQDKLRPNIVSWSAVISGFSQNGSDEETIEMLQRMQAEGIEPNTRTLASVLPACARLQMLSLGKEIHGFIMRRGSISNCILVNGLLDVYRKCADMRSAHNIFSKFSTPNVVSFNTMIVGYCENGEILEAKKLFDEMELAGFKKDVISWNSMISGYVDNSMFNEALRLFKNLLVQEGLETNSFTLGSVLTACTDTGNIRLGKEIHSHAIVRGLQCNHFVGGSLVEMYSKCRDLKAAQMAFNEVTEREIATWNALISGYARCNQMNNVQVCLQEMSEDGFAPNVFTWNGIIAGHVENDLHELAFESFIQMQTSDLQPDIYTVGAILRSSSRLATLEKGKQVHAHSVRHNYASDCHIGAALVDMYAKCGSIEHSQLAYNVIARHSLVTQNSMLSAYAMHGYGDEGIAFFRKMLIDGFIPDSVTFLSVLSSCVHAGSVGTGQEFFSLMGHFNLKPSLKHYTCMVDLFSRAGKLNEAHKLISTMPMQPDSVVWGALLGGCVIHGNVELGEVAAKRLLQIEPDKTVNYIMLANLYASTGQWDDLARTRQLIKDKQMHKNPGCSWIETGDEFHVFVAGDTGHESHEEIYKTLYNLTALMRLEQGIA